MSGSSIISCAGPQFRARPRTRILVFDVTQSSIHYFFEVTVAIILSAIQQWFCPSYNDIGLVKSRRSPHRWFTKLPWIWATHCDTIYEGWGIINAALGLWWILLCCLGRTEGNYLDFFNSSTWPVLRIGQWPPILFASILTNPWTIMSKFGCHLDYIPEQTCRFGKSRFNGNVRWYWQVVLLFRVGAWA